MTVLPRSRFLRHIRSLRKIAAALNIDPQLIVGTALREWTTNSFPGLYQGDLDFDFRLGICSEMQGFIKELAELPFLEAAYWLSSTYAQLTSDDRRKSLSMYFTPPSLTARLLDDLEKKGVTFGRGIFYDPACGGAAFLASIALRMKRRLYEDGYSASEVLNHIENHLIGTDLDVTLCKLSKQFLCMALYEEILYSKRKGKFRLEVANALDYSKGLRGHVDVVVCNPPYRKMQASEVKVCRPDYDEILEAQPNIYGVFIAMCAQLLRSDGICALVTPTSFLSGQNFKKLRNYLANNTCILQIGMVSERLGVFIDVEQETALTLFCKRDGASAIGNSNTLISVVSPDGNYIDVGFCRIKATDAPWAIPRSQQDIELLAAAGRLKCRISDFGYRVKVGTFVWNRDERPTYMSAGTAKRCKAATAVPLLWSSDIKQGELKFDGKKKKNGEPRFVNLGSHNHPSVVNNPSIILQRVTSNDQPRRLVAAAVPEWIYSDYGGFVGENHTVILEAIVDKPLLSCVDMADLLNTKVLDRSFRCISGATNVSAYELRNLPMPDVEKVVDGIGRGLSMEAAATEAMGEVGAQDGVLNNIKPIFPEERRAAGQYSMCSFALEF